MKSNSQFNLEYSWLLMAQTTWLLEASFCLKIPHYIAEQILISQTLNLNMLNQNVEIQIQNKNMAIV